MRRAFQRSDRAAINPATRAGDHHRYIVLDGLRGLAALVVVLWHTGATRLIPGGYLAVDFFFCLSGFVLSHAYEEAPLGFAGFARLRIVRLYPLYLLGALLGMLTFALRGPLNAQFWAVVPPALAFLPATIRWGRGYAPYPLDTPAWSLFFELVVNAVWFAALRRRTLPVLISVLALSAAGLAAAVVSRHSLADVGVSTGWFFVQGLPRAMFSFIAGVLVRRVRPPDISLPAFIAPAALLLLFATPGVQGPGGLAAVVLFPGLVWLASGQRLSGGLAALASWLGATSYAVYVLHMPLEVLLTQAATALHLAGGRHFAYLLAAFAIPLSLLAGAFAERCYDRPVRRVIGRSVQERFAGRYAAPADRS